MRENIIKKICILMLSFVIVVGFSANSFVCDVASADVAPTDIAKIENTGYATLQEAVNAATTGQTINLIADAAITETITVDKKITLDLGSNKITATGVNAITVKAGGDITINANSSNPGIIKSNKAAIYASHDDSAGKKTIVINGGIFDGSCTFNKWNQTGAKEQPLSVTINGGHFKKGITVYRCYYFTANGGTFDGSFTVGAHSTCKTYFKGGLYKTKPSAVASKVFVQGVWYNEGGYNRLAANNSACEASIGSTDYRYIAEALTAATDGQTVKLLKDVTAVEPGTIALGESVNLDLNGHKAEGSIAKVAGQLTVDLTVAGSQIADGSIAPEMYYELDKEGNTYTAIVPDTNAKARLDGVNYLHANDALNDATNGSNLELLEAVTDTKTLNKNDTLTIVYGTNANRDDSKINTVNGYKIETTVEGNKVTYKSVIDISQHEAKVGDNYYLTLYNAFAAVDGTEGQTIVILKDITRGGYICNRGAVVTLDLNGHKVALTSSGGSYARQFKITIDDTSANGDGVFSPSSLSGGYIEDINGGSMVTKNDLSSNLSDKCYSSLITEGENSGKYIVKVKQYASETDGEITYHKSFEDAIYNANGAGEETTISLGEDVEVTEKIVITGNVVIDTENTISHAEGYEGDLFEVKDTGTLKILGGTFTEDVSKYVSDESGDVTIAPRLDGSFVVVPDSDVIDTDTDGDNFADANNDLDGDGVADVNLGKKENIDTDYDGFIDEVTVEWKTGNNEYKEGIAEVGKNANQDLYFHFNISKDKFANEVKLNGKVINDYECLEGSTVIKLTSKYLDTLNKGNHTLEVKFTGLEGNNEYVSTAFAVNENIESNSGDKKPTTGDTGMMPWLAVMAVAAIGAVALKRKED